VSDPQRRQRSDRHSAERKYTSADARFGGARKEHINRFPNTRVMPLGCRPANGKQLISQGELSYNGVASALRPVLPYRNPELASDAECMRPNCGYSTENILFAEVCVGHAGHVQNWQSWLGVQQGAPVSGGAKTYQRAAARSCMWAKEKGATRRRTQECDLTERVYRVELYAAVRAVCVEGITLCD
jgi:hypothetical protein